MEIPIVWGAAGSWPGVYPAPPLSLSPPPHPGSPRQTQPGQPGGLSPLWLPSVLVGHVLAYPCARRGHFLRPPASAATAGAACSPCHNLYPTSQPSSFISSSLSTKGLNASDSPLPPLSNPLSSSVHCPFPPEHNPPTSPLLLPPPPFLNAASHLRPCYSKLPKGPSCQAKRFDNISRAPVTRLEQQLRLRHGYERLCRR